MVRVPEYQPGVELRPIFRQGVDVTSTPDDAGAAIGRGMQQFAQGVSDVGTALTRVRELEDVARAKEADNAYANELREAMYGEGGFMTLQGRNAVDQRKAFEERAEEIRKRNANGLTPGAARAYQTASQARIQSVYQQSIVHTANERKTWFAEASTARVETFMNDALANFNKPDLVTKNIGAGIMEIREQGQMQGWDADTLRRREQEFVSGIHKNVTLRMAQDDPLAADAYMKARANQITGADLYSLEGTLDSEVKNALSVREADAILTGTRQAAAPSAAAEPNVPAQRSVSQAGPTKDRAFLHTKLASHHNKEHVDGLSDTFATNLSAMMQDAPPGIREGLGIYSGFRSVDRQAELFRDAVSRYGSESAARKWVAPPGRSNHNHGKAADLSYNGRSLKHAPKEVVDWVHQNAGKYGLHFPMGHEPWHVEVMGTRGTAPGAASTVQARNDSVSPRSVMPSHDDIEARLSAIADPEVRDLTRKRINAQMEATNKAIEQREKAAKAELWSYVDRGATPDQVPMEVRQAAGMAAVSSAWGYLETAAKGRSVESDETLLYDMRRYAAQDPAAFAEIDLNDYRDRLAPADIKELTGAQTGALTDFRKAQQDGVNITAAFSQAQTSLEAIGITTVGLEGDKRVEAARREALFNNMLAQEMEAFKRENDGRNPNQMDIQSMINRLLLPVVIRESGERGIFNPLKTPWTSTWTTEREGRLFETSQRSDNSEFEVAVEYADIPIELRVGIARDMEIELGRKPSEEEIVARYAEIAISR